MWFGKRRALTALGATLERLGASSGGLTKSEQRELTAALVAIRFGQYGMAIKKLQSMQETPTGAWPPASPA
jgi:hypothetical protein